MTTRIRHMSFCLQDKSLLRAERRPSYCVNMADKHFGDRVREERKLRKWTQERLAEEASHYSPDRRLTQDDIAKIENRRARRSIHAPAISKGLRHSLSYMLTGCDPEDDRREMAYQEMTDLGVGWGQPPAALESQARVIRIPFLDSRASMGNGIALTDYVNVVEMISANRDELAKRCTFSSPSNLRLLTAYGNSMSPTFRDGDVLLVDTGMTTLTVDHVYVLQRDDELFIKRITRNPVDRTLFVMSSDNRDHPPFEIRPERDGFKVLAKVVSVWNFREL